MQRFYRFPSVRLNQFAFKFLPSSTYYAPVNEKSNLLLMGPPGCGKTSIGKLLSTSLNMNVYDIDDHHLEKTVWKQTVASKLSELGDDAFLCEETQATMLITPDTHSHTIISLTGSNPLSAELMQHLRQSGICIYLDCDQSEILNRCELMKIDRIIGQSSNSLENILNYRHNIYESCYDIRIIIEPNESLQSIHDKIVNVLQNEIGLNKSQLFISTRAHTNSEESIETNTLSNVILNGLSNDGGLYIPKNFAETLHGFTNGELDRICNENNYNDIALRVLETFPLDSNINSSKLRDIINDTYKSELFSNEKKIIPLRPLNDKLFLMELFHGNTASFKDIALQLFPKLFMNSFAVNDGKQKLFIVATSGDTGSAVLNGFNTLENNENISMIILYPKSGISAIQQMQMWQCQRENPKNILILRVENSDFDWCQNCIKNIFANDGILLKNDDFGLDYKLCSANSINWARLLPQIPFYFWGYKQLKDMYGSHEFDLCIPTGNFGHILGAIIAKRMGVPIRKLIIATNSNCVLYDFMTDIHGMFDNINRELNKTNSPSIDILLPSNLERYLYLISDENEKNTQFTDVLMNEYKQNKQFKISENMKKIMIENDGLLAGKSNDLQCLKMIQYIYDRYKVKIDPHTAVALDVAQGFSHDLFDESDSNNNIPMIVASTAHYSKFPETILKALTMDTEVKYDMHDLEYTQLFDILENEFKSENSIHPQIEKMVYENHSEFDRETDGAIQDCEADMTLIVDRIKNFLKDREMNLIKTTMTQGQ